jgi:Rrf2 family protein
MRLTKMSRFGTRAIFDLAYHSAGFPIHAKDIATRQDIPLKFLEQIFHKLKNNNIVRSVKGPNGGYMLARNPEQITVRDIIKAVREPVDIVHCVDDHTNCSRSTQCVTRLVWKEASNLINNFFDTVSINDLCERGKEIGIKRNIKIQHSFNYSI